MPARQQNRTPASGNRECLLGIEGGATRTLALLTSLEGALRRRFDVGPANVRLLTDKALVALLESFAVPARQLAGIAIGLAGARTEADRRRILEAAAQVWPQIPCYATNDLETALMAAGETDSPAGSRTTRKDTSLRRVLVLSGTGSCCVGRLASRGLLKVGGWGHLLGDRGSAYDLGLKALRATVNAYDATGTWPSLGARLLRKTQLNEPEDLIAWAQQAEKGDIAALAVEIFGAAHAGDRLARKLVTATAEVLAGDAVACARRLGGARSNVEFVFAGGMLLRQAGFRRAVARRIRRGWPKALITRLRREGVWGAVALARIQAKIRPPTLPGPDQAQVTVATRPRPPVLAAADQVPIPGTDTGNSPVDLLQLAQSPTERRNPRSRQLDRLSVEDAIDLMLDEDARIPAAVRVERPRIARVIRAIVRGLRSGGRLFYVGAGTSGRLGVLDASECPPTFRTPPELVQGVLAGGQRALWESAEGAEDDPAAGARALRFRRLTRRDVVVGIAASGRTPFVWGALDTAKARGAFTALLCFNPNLRVPRHRRPDVILAPVVGPEVVTGSTRLKAGTATKIILNMFTTLAMVRRGKVISNLMVDLNPSNVKLRDRAVRIVQELTGADPAAARHALEQTRWVVKDALRRARMRRILR